MTIKATEWAWRQTGLSSGEHNVLLALADAINQDHEFCFPSQDRIAEKCKKTVRHVRRCINRLTDLGMIRVEKGASRGRGKGRETARYFLACDHRTGEDRPFTAGHAEPLVSDTSGHTEPVVSVPEDVTGGHFCHLQGDISGRSPTPPNIDKPEIEPEKDLFSRQETTKSPKPPKTSKRVSHGENLPGFPELWAMWRAKDKKASLARKPCAEAYAKALKSGGTPEQIAAAARKFLQHPGWAKDGGLGLKGLAPFLNQELWVDLTEGDAGDGIDPAFRNATDDQLRRLVARYQQTGAWPAGCGEPMKLIPQRIRAEFGYGAAA